MAMTNEISAEFPFESKFVDVHGSKMHYIDEGEGDTILFLHGNPMSSYLWRNIIPHLSGQGRCIAPDLIGMGKSDHPDIPYRYDDQYRYLSGFIENLGIGSNVTLVIHDWGSGLGFDWANRHRDAVKGIAYMEAIVRPIASWDEWPEAARKLFQALRSPAGEQMILEKNVFVENILPGSVLRKLTDAEMAVYRRPFDEPGEGRRPTLTWPRQIPIAGEPEDVTAIARDYSAWLAESDVPKLFVNAEPGAILTGATREFCRSWPNQTEVTVAGNHFVQEDSPDEIGRAIADWLAGIA